MQQQLKLGYLKAKLTHYGQKLMANVVLQTQINLRSGLICIKQNLCLEISRFILKIETKKLSYQLKWTTMRKR